MVKVFFYISYSMKGKGWSSDFIGIGHDPAYQLMLICSLYLLLLFLIFFNFLQECGFFFFFIINIIIIFFYGWKELLFP